MTLRDQIHAALAQCPEADRLPTLRRMVELYRERIAAAADPEHSEANRATLAAAVGMLSEARPQEVAEVRSLMQAEADRLRGQVAKRWSTQPAASRTCEPEERAWSRLLGDLLALYPADIVREADVHFVAPDLMDLLRTAANG